MNEVADEENQNRPPWAWLFWGGSSLLGFLVQCQGDGKTAFAAIVKRVPFVGIVFTQEHAAWLHMGTFFWQRGRNNSGLVFAEEHSSWLYRGPIFGKEVGTTNLGTFCHCGTRFRGRTLLLALQGSCFWQKRSAQQTWETFCHCGTRFHGRTRLLALQGSCFWQRGVKRDDQFDTRMLRCTAAFRQNCSRSVWSTRHSDPCRSRTTLCMRPAWRPWSARRQRRHWRAPQLACA